MIWMLMCVVTGAAFGHIMRNAQQRCCSMSWVGAWNYLAAAVACWVWWALTPDSHLGWEGAILGTLCGLCFVGAYFLMNSAIRAAGVGITQSIQWLGVALPVTASILIWRELPSLVQTLGLLLALIAFPLLACGHAAADAPKNRWKVLFLAGLFLLEGSVSLIMKFYSRDVPTGSESAFLAFLFSAAAIGNVAMTLRQERAGLRDFVHGFGMGAANVLCNLAILRALAVLPGTIVFPTISAGSIVLTAVIGAMLWRERYYGGALAGLILAALSLILINLPTP